MGPPKVWGFDRVVKTGNHPRDYKTLCKFLLRDLLAYDKPTLYLQESAMSASTLISSIAPSTQSGNGVEGSRSIGISGNPRQGYQFFAEFYVPEKKLKFNEFGYAHRSELGVNSIAKIGDTSFIVPVKKVFLSAELVARIERIADQQFMVLAKHGEIVRIFSSDLSSNKETMVPVVTYLTDVQMNNGNCTYAWEYFIPSINVCFNVITGALHAREPKKWIEMGPECAALTQLTAVKLPLNLVNLINEMKEMMQQLENGRKEISGALRELVNSRPTDS